MSVDIKAINFLLEVKNQIDQGDQMLEWMKEDLKFGGH